MVLELFLSHISFYCISWLLFLFVIGASLPSRSLNETPYRAKAHFLFTKSMSEVEKVVAAEEKVEEKPVAEVEAEKKAEEEEEEVDAENNMDANKESEKKKKKKKKSKKKVVGMRLFWGVITNRFHQAGAALSRRFRGLVREVGTDRRFADSCCVWRPHSHVAGFHFRRLLSSR